MWEQEEESGSSKGRRRKGMKGRRERTEKEGRKDGRKEEKEGRKEGK
jgi:hypothetical protein